jgi:putative hemolysin
MLAFILTVSISLAITCICSILEAVLLSLSATDIAGMSEKRPRAAFIWKHMKESIHQPIAVILIVNTFAHTIGASLSGAQFYNLFGGKWIILYSIVYSLVMIQWAEILPKSLAVTKNKAFAIVLAHPMRMLMKIFKPAVYVVDLLNKPFASKKGGEDEGPLSDIAVLARYARTSKMISDRQEMIVEQSLMLSKIKVSDIMIPRAEIKHLSDDMSLAEALVEAHIHHHTRFPLAKGGDLDDVVGYVNFKDIVSALQLNPKDPSLKGICRPMMKIDSQESVSSLLNKLIKSYQHIGIVTGPFGKVAGVVTLEDVIESIVGEINDEYDLLPEYVYQIAKDRYVVGGGVRMSRLSSEFCRPISEEDITLSDWVSARLGRAPKAEDTVEHDEVVVNVRKTRRSCLYEAVVFIKNYCV